MKFLFFLSHDIRHKLNTSLLFTLSIYGSQQLAFAGEKEDRIIDKAIHAYGGQQLMALESLHLSDTFDSYFYGQSGHAAEGPHSIHFESHKVKADYDLTTQQTAFRRITDHKVGNFSSQDNSAAHQLFFDNQGFMIDHCTNEVFKDEGVNAQSVDIGTRQTIDTLLIKQLARDRQHSQWQDTAYIAGKKHDVLDVHHGTEKHYSVYINQQTGMLSRYIKAPEQTYRKYDFWDHQQTAGISWAKQILVSLKERPRMHTNSRQISFNQNIKNSLNFPPNYQHRAMLKEADFSKMAIQQLANNAYLVGSGWGHTLFIDTGEYLITMGAWKRSEDSKDTTWKQRYQLLTKTIGKEKPVKYHIFSHHHQDHLSALPEIVKLGATFYVHESHLASVQKELKTPLAKERFISVGNNGTAIGDDVIIFDVPNGESSHNLVAFLPESGTVFSEDMFISRTEKGLPRPTEWTDWYNRLRFLNAKIKQLGLDAKQFAAAHSGRVLTKRDIDKALTFSCPSNEVLAEKLFAQNK